MSYCPSSKGTLPQSVPTLNHLHTSKTQKRLIGGTDGQATAAFSNSTSAFLHSADLNIKPSSSRLHPFNTMGPTLLTIPQELATKSTFTFWGRPLVEYSLKTRVSIAMSLVCSSAHVRLSTRNLSSKSWSFAVRMCRNNVNSPIRTSAIGLLQHLQLLDLPS
jgi:hypothetical protein